jgi:3D (Asp-Asp-Asp) domain-containing protein
MTLQPRSLAWQVLTTAVVAVALVFLAQSTARGPRDGADSVADSESPSLSPGTRAGFIATAYCKGTTTRSGTAVVTGTAAADPKVLPLGSIIRIDGTDARTNGLWVVLDTGPKVRGYHVDLYMWSCTDALAFGRRPVSVTVLRRGWDPGQSVGGTAGSQASE